MRCGGCLKIEGGREIKRENKRQRNKRQKGVVTSTRVDCTMTNERIGEIEWVMWSWDGGLQHQKRKEGGTCDGSGDSTQSMSKQ